jgi:hypothetical protein
MAAVLSAYGKSKTIVEILRANFFSIGRLDDGNQSLPSTMHVPKCLIFELCSLRIAHHTLLILCSFALGNLVQEAGDRLIKTLVGKRFFKQARDRFWTSGLKKDVCDKIGGLGGPVNPSVDAALISV